MEKRYQVFVSSTFNDLREERAACISALLQIDCFPAGMEIFPAADDDSLTLIKNVIDDSDYYLVILAGRYGSLEKSSGKSFTHLEYEYALSKGKPTIALIHSEPTALAASKCEGSDKGRKSFEAFRTELQKKNCKPWCNLAELMLAVLTGILHLKRTRPADGWVKATGLDAEALKDELLRVRRELEAANVQLEQTRRLEPPTGSEALASGPDTTTIGVIFMEGAIEVYSFTWNEILRSVFPHTLGEGANETAIAGALKTLARKQALETSHLIVAMITGPRQPIAAWKDAAVSGSSFGIIMNQMVALGLVQATPDVINKTLWRATPYGIQEGSRMLAIRRSSRIDEATTISETAKSQAAESTRFNPTKPDMTGSETLPQSD